MSQTESLPKNARPKWVVPVVFVVVAAVVVLLSNRSEPAPNGLPLIASADQYRDTMQQAENLLTDPLNRAESGQDLSAADKQNLQQAALLLEAANRFEPNQFEADFLLGKIEQATGEDSAAESHMQQAIFNGQEQLRQAQMKNDQDQAHKVELSLIDADYTMSLIKFDEHDYAEAFKLANVAVRQAPGVNPDYLAARASALVQLNRVPEAKQDIAAALKADPNHRRSHQLQMLLK